MRTIHISIVVRNILRIARVWRTIVPCVVMPRVPGRCRMRRRCLRRTVLRRRGRQGHRHGQPEPTPPSTEFAPAFHKKSSHLHLCVRILLARSRVVTLHRLRQIT